jgi:hypothetical protein
MTQQVANMAVHFESGNESTFEIRFQSLFDAGRALTFPCDASGHVELDALSERARNNYFFARAVVGRDYAAAVVVAREAP